LIYVKARATGRGDTETMSHPLTREVAVVVALKLMLVLAAALLVFGPGQRPRIDVGAVESRLIGTPDVHSHLRNIAP